MIGLPYRIFNRADYSSLSRLSFRISDEFDEIPDDPRDALPIMSQYKKLDEQGHGFRSFVGVSLSLLLSTDRVVLIDEPEAFLHPAQARRLGSWIAEHANSTSAQVLLTTHNSNFLTGVLSETSNVRIYRLDRPDREQTYFHEVPPETIHELSRDPLLSSQRVIESVFHQGVIVCEGGSDRSVYRFVAVDELGYDEMLFIDALGIDKVDDIVETVANSRIPVVGIVDIDVLSDHNRLKQLLLSFDDSLAFDDIRPLLDERRVVADEVEQEDIEWDQIKQTGLSGLPESVRDDARKLLHDVCEYGLYIVPVGELESWMELGVRKQ